MIKCKITDMPLFMLDNIDLILEVLEIAINTIFYHRFDDETILEKGKITDFSFYKSKSKSKEISALLAKIYETIKIQEKINFELNFYEKEQTSYFLQTYKENMWEKWTFTCVWKKTNNVKLSDNTRNEIKEKLFKMFEEINNGIDYMPSGFMSNKIQPYEIVILNEPKKKSIFNMFGK